MSCAVSCQAKLPVSSETLRYGSADGANTVVVPEEGKDNGLREKLERTAHKLNLRPHYIKEREGEKKEKVG